MKFSKPEASYSSSTIATETPRYRRRRRRIPSSSQSTTQESSYGETGTSQSQESPTNEEDTYIDDDDYDGEENLDDDDDEYEYEEQSRSTTDNPYTKSKTIRKAQPGSNRSSNTVQALPVNGIFSPSTRRLPEFTAYVNIAPLPIFQGESGECPVTHLSRFARVCRANNALSTDMMMRIFPVTLDGEAALWYELNIEPYPTLIWEEIKSSFIQAYRRIEIDELRSELMTIRQGDAESVNTYYLRLQWMLKKWPEHGLPNEVLKGIFIDGLKEDSQDWIIPHKPNSLDEALRLALGWEQAQSIRDARRRNASNTARLAPVRRDTIKCGFCDGPHEEGTCEIRRRMRELWVKSKDKPPISSTNLMPDKSMETPSPASSILQRQGEDSKDQGMSDCRKSQCQCWKHQCWKKNGILTRNYSTIN